LFTLFVLVKLYGYRKFPKTAALLHLDSRVLGSCR
jgi:hypothetical protein